MSTDGSPAARSWLRVHGVPAALLLTASALITGPVLLHPTRELPFFMGDGMLTVWNYWWAKKALVDLGTNPFATHLLCHPQVTSLVFHSHDLLHGVLSIPFQLLLGHPRGLILATNFVLLLCYWLSALAAYACAWSETRDRFASSAAGIGYGFCSFHVSWFVMPVVTAMYWVPLYLLALRRALTEPGIAWTAAAGLCVLLCTFQSLYFTALLGLVTGVVLAFHLATSRFDRRAALRALRVAAVLGLAVAPMAAITLNDLARTAYLAPNFPSLLIDDTASVNSVDLAGLVIPSDKQGWWRLVPGVASWNEYLDRPWQSVSGARVNPDPMFRNGRGGLIAYVGVVALILAGIGAACRWRRSTLLWVLLLGASLGVAMGPNLHLHGEIFRSAWLPLPYRLLSLVAPHSVARMFKSPYTFMAVANLALWVLAAQGIAWLRERVGAGLPRALVTSALAVWLVGEHAYASPIAYPVILSPGLERIAADPRSVSVLELPASDPFQLEVYSFRQALHEKPIARGYLARIPSAVRERDRQLSAIGDSPEALEAVLAQLRPVYVVVHPQPQATPADRRQASMIEAVLGKHKIYESIFEIVYAPDLAGGG